MKLIEADGKKLLRDAGSVLPEGLFIAWNDALPSFDSLRFPAFLKAQVLQGRRGKRGWIRRCEHEADVRKNVDELREELRDVPCAGFLLESDVPHESEWLVSLSIDRERQLPIVSFSSEGGMSVEQAQSFPISSADDLKALDVPPGVKDILERLAKLFFAQDALSIEVNPLAVLADGSCIALDAKVELDDAATFRHPEWSAFRVLPEAGRRLSVREEAYAQRESKAGHRGTLGRYVELDGDIALILSGGGASLVAMDALKAAGGHAANYVEMSGNPDPESVREATKIVLRKPGIKAIWIAGSFANFTDIQATTGAVLQAVTELGLKVPIVIRRDGPNVAEAKVDAARWSSEQGISVRFDGAEVDLDASARFVVEAAKNL